MTTQLSLLEDARAEPSEGSRSGTFVDNMRLPVHRWFRYSAGFSAEWVGGVIRSYGRPGDRILDPFAGSGTTLIAAQQHGFESVGIEPHPFVRRVAHAKMQYSSSQVAFRTHADRVLADALDSAVDADAAPTLMKECYDEHALAQLEALRIAIERHDDSSPASALSWLALVGILRSTSRVGTAPWQYLLPTRSKRVTLTPFDAYERAVAGMIADMSAMRSPTVDIRMLASDARSCEGVSSGSVSLVICSPPYANNYDYADATRLEMTFFREIQGWGDLQSAVRRHLMRSCSQHALEPGSTLEGLLGTPELAPIRKELTAVCSELAAVRLTKGGKKNYHLMVAAYFADMARTWRALRRVAAPEARVCMVLGDSAPYGVYVPVLEWNGTLACAAGFADWSFEKVRDRNLKWKNRKHRVPLVEGRLWVRSAISG